MRQKKWFNSDKPVGVQEVRFDNTIVRYTPANAATCQPASILITSTDICVVNAKTAPNPFPERGSRLNDSWVYAGKCGTSYFAIEPPELRLTGAVTWDEAAAHIEKLKTEGHQGSRMPSLNELELMGELIDYDRNSYARIFNTIREAQHPDYECTYEIPLEECVKLHENDPRTRYWSAEVAGPNGDRARLRRFIPGSDPYPHGRIVMQTGSYSKSTLASAIAVRTITL